jgi:hypothetical protein
MIPIAATFPFNLDSAVSLGVVGGAETSRVVSLTYTVCFFSSLATSFVASLRVSCESLGVRAGKSTAVATANVGTPVFRSGTIPAFY